MSRHMHCSIFGYSRVGTLQCS